MKVWNNNGTTSLLCFKPMVEGNIVQEQDKEERRYHEGSSQNNYDKMQEKIEMLERKIDELQKIYDKEIEEKKKCRLSKERNSKIL